MATTTITNSDIFSLTERAVAAYIIAAGAGTMADTSESQYIQNRGYPNTTVIAVSNTLGSDFSGNDMLTLHISIKGSAAVDPSVTDFQSPRIAFNNRVGATRDALRMTDNNVNYAYTAAAITTAGRALATSNAADNSDMSGFTCLAWYELGGGLGSADDDGCSWERILIFKALVCPSAIS